MNRAIRLKKSVSQLLAVILTATMMLSVIAMPVTAVAAQQVTQQEAKIQTMKEKLPDAWQKSREYKGINKYDELSGILRFTGFQKQGRLYVTVSKETKSFGLSINGTVLDCSKMFAGKDKTYVIDYSDLAMNGSNMLCLSNLKPAKANVKIYVPYPTVIEGKPEDVGMDEDTLSLIDELVSSEIKFGFSAAQLAVIKDGELVVNQAWGNVTGWTSYGATDKSSAQVTTDTLFDLASNSKMYTVNYAVQKLVSDGKLNLDEKVSTYLPGFKDSEQDTIKGKDQITVRNILKHQAGFPSTWKYYNPELAKDLYCQDRSEMLDKLCRTPLEYATGTKTVYSDLDYMLLCLLVEKITDQRFDIYLRDNFYDQLGLKRTTFQPLLHGFKKDECAATELNGNTRDGAVSFPNIRTELIQGEVHDEKAYYCMGGVSGHAGLFSTASELAKLCQVMINGGGYGDHKFFEADVIDEFTKGKGYDSSASAWGLGWWREADHSTRLYYFGPQSSSETYGHQGWTGTISVIDPVNHLVIVFLTNKKNSPVIDNVKAPSDFVCDNYALGSLGIISGYVYEALNTDQDEAVDANAYTVALERVKQFSTRIGTYDTAVHMTDSYAMVEWMIARAQERKTDVCKEYAQKVLNEVNAIVEANSGDGKISEENVKLANRYKMRLQKTIDGLVTEPSSAVCKKLNTYRVADNPEGTGAQAVLKFPSILGTPSNSRLFGGNIYTFNAYPDSAVLYASITTEQKNDIRMFINGTEIDLTDLKDNTQCTYAIDFSEICRNGDNTIQVSGISPEVAAGEGMTVYLNYPSAAKEDSSSQKDWSELDQMIQKSIKKEYSGQLAVIQDGRIVKNTAYGKDADVEKEYCMNDEGSPLSTLFMAEMALSDGTIKLDANQTYTLAELQSLVETAADISMQDYVAQKIYYKMGLDHIQFVTEPDQRVNLYSNALCLAKLGQMVINGGGYGKQKIYEKNIGDFFNACKDGDAGSSSFWMRQGDLKNSQWFGDLASRKAIGYFSKGSFLIVDPEQHLVIAYTTNVPESTSNIILEKLNTLIYKTLMFKEEAESSSKAA